MNWAIIYYSESVQADILALPANLLARYLRFADRMEVYGPDLGMPHTRAMGGGLFELRLKATEGIARVLYCTMIGKRIMILQQFREKDQEDTAKGLWHSSTAYDRGQRC